MRLDVVIPTYNRAGLLARTLASLQRAHAPEGLDVHVTVVDNNSKDDTRGTVERLRPGFGGRLHYLLETQQGRSAALNAGIRATSGELVGMIDDDEEVDPEWTRVIARTFRQRPELDFIGGPVLRNNEVAIPAWLPMDYPSIIGVIDGGREERTYGVDYPGILMGGNAVIRRALLDRVGLYNTALGRTDKGLLTGEDDDMFSRLIAAGGRGKYLPDLVVYHHVPVERLTRRYYRSWCFWHGVSMGVLDHTRPQPVAYLFGIPRYVLGNAVKAVARTARMLLRARLEPAQAFSNELKLWSAAGYFYGKHFRHRTAR